MVRQGGSAFKRFKRALQAFKDIKQYMSDSNKIFNTSI